ncbi:hypothetical protein [Dictyobacter vulcani]|uniref:hypothetical protein n=1 Tax=Dictyobacter vulcani TaxID=2607529 RepID=UPI00124F9EC3|nr:hypothetical protein [Dictyobacter vulcani]
MAPSPRMIRCFSLFFMVTKALHRNVLALVAAISRTGSAGRCDQASNTKRGWVIVSRDMLVRRQAAATRANTFYLSLFLDEIDESI